MGHIPEEWGIAAVISILKREKETPITTIQE
jgi:hypothetical protein